MFTLTDTLKNEFQYKEHTLSLNISFDNILRVFELFDDPLFESYEKVLIFLEMLVVEYELIKEVGFKEKFDLYNYILREFLNMGSNEDEEEEEQERTETVMDFKRDAGLIYVSFLSEYGIDLFKEQGKLHWYQFSELLSNLGEKTAFKKAVGYRAMKVPSTKEATKEYREHIQKMKKLYSLSDEKEIDQVAIMESKLDSIASTFSRGGE